MVAGRKQLPFFQIYSVHLLLSNRYSHVQSQQKKYWYQLLDMFNVNNKDIERREAPRKVTFVVNFQQILHLVTLFTLFILNS